MVDIVDVDLTKDGDLCGQDHLQNLYKQAYTCVSSKALDIQKKLYVLQLEAQWQENSLAAALSDGQVHITAIDTLKTKDTLKAHQDGIIGLRYLPENPDVLITASNDGSVRVWDLRTATKGQRKPQQEFMDDSSGQTRPLLSFDVDCKGWKVCAGTEKIKKEAVHLLFWDLRSAGWLGSFADSHDDDICHVRPGLPVDLLTIIGKKIDLIAQNLFIFMYLKVSMEGDLLD